MNINEYLTSELGKRSFLEGGYNQEDALVLSTLTYMKFEKSSVIYSSKNENTINKVLNRYYGTAEYNLLPENKKIFVNNLMNNDRYKNLIISDFSVKTSKLNGDGAEQFAAMTVNLPDGSNVVAFRGTDGTLEGWKEDFNFAYLQESPAQALSKEYLNSVGKATKGKLYVTGHSKGGHEAIYSSMTCDEDVRNKIAKIYNFDGPGIRRDIIDKYGENYRNIQNKLISYVPPTSIIGMLFVDHESIQCIKSTNSFIMQHDQFSWEFDEDGNFSIDPKGVDSTSKFLNKTLDDTLDGLTQQERNILINTIWEFAVKGHPKNFDDAFKEYRDSLSKAGKLKFISKLLNDFNNLSIEKKEVLTKALSVFCVASVNNGAIDYARTSVDKLILDTKEKLRKNLDNFMNLCGFLGVNPLLVQVAGQICNGILSGVNSVINSFLSWVEKKITDGKGITGGNYGVIRVNLDEITTLVNRLNSVKRRILALDSDLDRLRRSLEWYEGYDYLIIALIDLLEVGYDSDIRKCINYLDIVVNKMTTCEQILKQQALNMGG